MGAYRSPESCGETSPSSDGNEITSVQIVVELLRSVRAWFWVRVRFRVSTRSFQFVGEFLEKVRRIDWEPSKIYVSA